MGLFRQKSNKAKPSLPEGIRVYAISDIHGRSDLLQQLFTVIDVDIKTSQPARAIQVFLGDYVDRGPDSRGVLDLLIERGQSHETVFLKGNHESFFLDVLHDPAKLSDWRQYGGLLTLLSYGVHPTMNPNSKDQVTLIKALVEAMPADHVRFLENLQPSFTCGDFFFVHAGVRPGVPLDKQREEDLFWIREDFLNSEDDFGKFVVHGHTPVSVPDIRRNRINIDTGAYATGNLTLLTMQGDSLMAI
ncbi:MAG: serine/threonine protein phosphatase [Tardiphaga sp.]|jgi:serine/threonine protein phosphatase 1|nr:serine/threonine protein phosphatase [Tardiphaga sp.]